MQSPDQKIQPVRFSQPVADGQIAGWRWENETAPPLLFCHATGFCASTYKQLLGHVSARYDVYAIDMRGHGRTNLPANPRQLRSWHPYAKDVGEFLDTQNRKKWTLAGHSMGAVTATLTAAKRDDICAIKLIEPVAMPPLVGVAASLPFWKLFMSRVGLAKGAASRRAKWQSRTDTLAAYRKKMVFQSWGPNVLADYLEDGLRETREGVELACAPAWEAATFSAHAHHFWRALSIVEADVTVLAAADKTSTLLAGAARRFRKMGVSLTMMEDVTHLAPMEKPIFVADFVVSAPQA